ncbi:MAG: hypothetical protein ACFCU1_10475 [Sumerlaeia bacterium]
MNLKCVFLSVFAFAVPALCVGQLTDLNILTLDQFLKNSPQSINDSYSPIILVATNEGEGSLSASSNLPAQINGQSEAKFPETALANATITDSFATPTTPAQSTTASNLPSLAIEVETPFSLTDCINGVGKLIETLDKASKKEGKLENNNVVEVFASIMDYLRDRDDLHYTLVNYKWSPMDRIKVQQQEITRIWPDEVSRQKSITALSFEVEAADAVIWNLKIKNQQGEELNNFVGEVVLRHSLPRRYVYHLYNPTDIYSLSFNVRKENSDQEFTPIVIIQAGKADHVEHGKLALYYLIRAEEEFIEGKIEKSAATLRFAQGEIENFRRQSRR